VSQEIERIHFTPNTLRFTNGVGTPFYSPEEQFIHDEAYTKLALGAAVFNYIVIDGIMDTLAKEFPNPVGKYERTDDFPYLDPTPGKDNYLYKRHAAMISRNIEFSQEDERGNTQSRRLVIGITDQNILGYALMQPPIDDERFGQQEVEKSYAFVMNNPFLYLDKKFTMYGKEYPPVIANGNIVFNPSAFSAVGNRLLESVNYSLVNCNQGKFRPSHTRPDS
jgi:hypothetical protein